MEPLTDKITQIFQLHGEVHIVHNHGIRHFEHDGGKVQNGLDTGGDQLIDDLLGSGSWDGKDSHLDTLGGNKVVHPRHDVDRDGGLDIPGAQGVLVKSGYDFKTFLIKPTITEQGSSEIPYSNEDDRLEPGSAQHLIDAPGEHFHIVTKTAGAEIPEICQILAKLGRLDPSGAGKRFGGYGLNAILAQPGEATLIDRKPVYGFSGTIDSFWHGEGRLTIASLPKQAQVKL